MKIGGLTLFKRQVDNHGCPARSVIIAAWHPSWSLTWGFILSYDHSNKHRPKYKSRFAIWRKNRMEGFYFHAGVRPPLCGLLSLETQPTMRKK